MLSKNNRGLTASDITDLFEGSDGGFGTAFFHVVWLRHDDPDLRMVVITPGKLHRSAAVRNKVKRRVYQALRSMLSRWTPGLRVAIVVKKKALSLDATQFRDACDQMLEQISARISTS